MSKLLKNILDDTFLEKLAKSADLYKMGSNSVLDPQEILIGLKVVPRAVMALLISELGSMDLLGHKDIQLPFGKDAFIRVNKNSADDFTGSIYSDNKQVYDFKNRSIPGLGIILLSTFELYDVEDLHKPKVVESEDINHKVQKLIDERMELHSLVHRVVEEKMSQREAVHRVMMAKLGEAMKPESIQAPAEIPSKPIDLKPSDIVKKESSPKKVSPLKDFLEKKKNKGPVEHRVEVLKNDIACDDCGQRLFKSDSLTPCLCFGNNQESKIYLSKKEDGSMAVRFSRSWSVENIELFLETLRSKK